jgi:hypothetical protein
LLARGSDETRDWQALVARAPVSAVELDAAGCDTMYADVSVLNAVDSITYDFSTFARFGTFGARAPNLRTLSVSVLGGPFNYEFDGALESLHVREGAQSHDSVVALAQNPRLSGLRRLALTIEQAPALAAALDRWPLDRLDLVFRQPAVLGDLATGRLAQTLSSLSLDFSTPPQLEGVLARPWPRLRQLRLPLVGSAQQVKTMEALESVEQLHTALDDEAAEALASLSLRTLRSLTVRADSAFTGRGLEALLRAPWAASLEHLEFGRLQFDAAGLEAFAQARLPRLHWLGLPRARLDEAGLRRLAQGALPVLERFDVDAALWPALVRALPSLPSSLLTLKTGGAERDDVLRALASDRMAALRLLDLSGPTVDGEVQQALCSGRFDQLETLIVTAPGARWVERLETHFDERLVVTSPQRLL